VTVIADKFQGKRLNSPNDIVVHPDGGIWFTDPIYGVRGTYEGFKADSEIKEAVYRVDGKAGQIEKVTDQPAQPNGICFSPDYTKVYVIRSGGISVGDIQGHKAVNMRPFTDCRVDGVRCGPDGMRADRAGNIWCSSAAPLGYAGVTVWNQDGKLIGRIRLPEGCANLCFAGPKRDHLFMAATQSIYMLRVNIQGAAPG